MQCRVGVDDQRTEALTDVEHDILRMGTVGVALVRVVVTVVGMCVVVHAGSGGLGSQLDGVS